MKQLTKNFIVFTIILIVSAITINAQHQMNHSKMDSTKKMMQHQMKDSSNHMDHKMMTDSSKMHFKNMKHNQMKMQKDSLVRTGEINIDAIDKNKDGMVYQDPMDWNVISDKPGRCPLCEMKLKEVSIKEAKENLVKHGHKVKGHMHNKMDHDKMKDHEDMMNKENPKDHKDSMHEKKGNSTKKKK